MSYDSPIAARPRIEFAPVPANFEMIPVRREGRDPRALTAGGLCHWLSQSQTDLTGPAPVYTSRNVVQVTGSEGLQPAASVTIPFNPEYERLVIHAVQVHRDGAVRDAGRPEAFELIQRELNMERAVYDGRVTAHMVIPDIREGDTVETIVSIIGAHPALEGLFSWWFILQWNIPVPETRCTVRVAPDRPLTLRAVGPAVTTRDQVIDGVRVLEWEAVDAPPMTVPPGAPMSWHGYSAAHVADAADWARIADVFRPFYAPGPLPEDLATEVEALARTYLTPAARIVEGLRLVQGTLRYHSVSIGDGGYRPRSLAAIRETRYGDCKDASLLLTAVLRAMGIDAVCALVNTVRGEDLKAGLAHVLAFNHCIVRVRLAGETVWLDPTLPVQAGDLSHLTRAHFHYALPLEAGAELEVMPPAKLRTICEVDEVWDLPFNVNEPAGLKMTTIYRAWRADGMRHWLGNQSRDAVARQMREGLERELRSTLTPVGEVEIHDAAADNVLTVVEHYRVNEPFAARENGARLFVSRDEVVGPHLMDIAADRPAPLQLGLPRRVETRRHFRLARPVAITPWRREITGPAGLRLESGFVWQSTREGVQTLSLVVPESLLSASDVAAYRTFVEEARGLNGITFPMLEGDPPRQSSRRDRGRGDGFNWYWLILPGLLALSAVLRAIGSGY